ncbi:glycosyltransferase family 2 protein [uncultured Paracoccus sp.]|uniref:glycosyltransferase family 2 protein n=1 Tax=uncultured Paracoccus sp. TaxID=189685 RepID=UPI00261BCEC3|nr:glycosyltransferase family 2 protein [uncultured Paracoccus sp.]
MTPSAAVGPTGPAVSVVVVSRYRPAALARCVHALTLQDHPCFELVVVADPAAARPRPDLPIRRVVFDRANISAARNAGIRAAAGEIIAFLDDDAVAEPTWLSRLAAPFSNQAVLAATGVTRGRDGVRWQVRAERIGPDSLARSIPVQGGAVRLLCPQDGQPVSTLGTNCAFRRAALVEIGGFDPAFAYHLDESDLNMRMASRWPDAPTAIVPGAEVAHGWAGSEHRSAAGVPRDLTVIGRSTGIFCTRHGGDPAFATGHQRRRLLRLMLAGRLDPGQVRPLMQGFRTGLQHAPAAPAPVWAAGDAAPAFAPLPGTGPRPARFIAGWHWQAARLRADAARAAAAGQIVTLLLLTPTLLPHRVRFAPEGFWEQRGGLWGPSDPGDSPFTPWRLQDRISHEAKRVMQTRLTGP